MGALLFHNGLLGALKSYYGSDYMILGVLPYGIILAETNADKGYDYWKQLQYEVWAEIKADFLSEYIFAYEEGTLKCLEEKQYGNTD